MALCWSDLAGRRVYISFVCMIVYRSLQPPDPGPEQACDAFAGRRRRIARIRPAWLGRRARLAGAGKATGCERTYQPLKDEELGGATRTQPRPSVGAAAKRGNGGGASAGAGQALSAITVRDLMISQRPSRRLRRVNSAEQGDCGLVGVPSTQVCNRPTIRSLRGSGGRPARPRRRADRKRRR